MENTITFQTLKPLLVASIKTNQVPFLAGTPGIGKSAVLKELAKTFNTKVFVLSVNQLGTREDLTGARAIMDEKTKTYRQVFFPHAIIQDCIDYANEHPDETPFLFLDEINRTGVDVTSAIMALITERRIGTTPLPDNIRLIAAGNDTGNVNTMDEASNSRMSIYHVTPDIQSFMAAQPDLNYYIKQLLSKSPNLLLQESSVDVDMSDDDDDDDDDGNNFMDNLDSESMKQITVPRTLTHLSELLNALGLDGQTLPSDLSEIYNPFGLSTDSGLYLMIVATIGKTATAMQLFDEITNSITELSNDPSTMSSMNTVDVNIPTPNKGLLDAVQSASSNDEITDLLDEGSYSTKECLDTFFSLINTDNFAKLQSVDAVRQYYTEVVSRDDIDDNEIKAFSQTFVELLRYQMIPQTVIQQISNATDKSDLTSRLKLLITTLG